jgi:hypothetical protein
VLVVSPTLTRNGGFEKVVLEYEMPIPRFSGLVGLHNPNDSMCSDAFHAQSQKNEFPSGIGMPPAFLILICRIIGFYMQDFDFDSIG